jgi:uncharacterized protein (DUF427 family)
VALFESGLPARWYLPREDVVAELESSDTITHCAYKGEARYHSVALDGAAVGRGKDLIWYYADPKPEVGAIAGRLCFWGERVDLELDGVAQERPRSARSR